MTRHPLLLAVGNHVSKFLNLNVSETKLHVPKQRYDRFLSVEDHIHMPLLLELAWATQGHTVIGGSQKSKE